VGQIRHADPGETFDGAIDDVDGIVAEIRIDDALRRAVPALELAPAHRGDEPDSRGLVEIAQRPALRCLRRAGDGAQRAAVEVHIGRPRLAYPDAEQRQRRRLGELLIDEMGDAGLARADRQRVADRFQRLDLGGGEHLEGRALCAGLPRGEQHLDAAHAEGERTDRGAFDESPAGHVVHERVLPCPAAGVPRGNAGSLERTGPEMNRGVGSVIRRRASARTRNAATTVS